MQRSAAEIAFQPIADQLHKTVEQAADQLIQVAAANMYTELSNVMEQQGFDPRDFSLLAFGGQDLLSRISLREKFMRKMWSSLQVQGHYVR